MEWNREVPLLEHPYKSCLKPELWHHADNIHPLWVLFSFVFFFILIVAGLSVCVLHEGVVRKLSDLCGRALRTSGMVTDSPHTGLLLSTSSKTLPTTTPGMAGTSGHAAISLYLWPAGPSGGRPGLLGISSGPFHQVHRVDLSLPSNKTHHWQSMNNTNILFFEKTF